MKKTNQAIALMRSSYKNKWHKHDDIFGQFNAMHTYSKKNDLAIAEAIECRLEIGSEAFAVNELMSKAYNVCRFNPQVDTLLVADITRIATDYEQYKYWEEAFSDKGIQIKAVNQTEWSLEGGGLHTR